MVIPIIVLGILVIVLIFSVGVMSDNNVERDAKLDKIEEVLGIGNYRTEIFNINNEIKNLRRRIEDLPSNRAEKAQVLLEQAKELLEDK